MIRLTKAQEKEIKEALSIEIDQVSGCFDEPDRVEFKLLWHREVISEDSFYVDKGNQ